MTVPEAGLHQQARARVLSRDESGEVTGFRFQTRAMTLFDLPADRIRPVHAANSALSALTLDERFVARFPLAAGEAVLFDNHRVMHGRYGFSDPKRHLQISNVSRERFHQRYGRTAQRLGLTHEANLRLSVGVAG